MHCIYQHAFINILPPSRMNLKAFIEYTYAHTHATSHSISFILATMFMVDVTVKFGLVVSGFIPQVGRGDVHARGVQRSTGEMLGGTQVYTNAWVHG